MKRSVSYQNDRASDSWNAKHGHLAVARDVGGYSTVEDLQKLAEALKELTTGKAETGDGDKYAYGFMDRTSGGVRSYGHGGAPAMNGELAIFPQSGCVVAVLANLDPPAAQRIASFIGYRLPER